MKNQMLSLMTACVFISFFFVVMIIQPAESVGLIVTTPKEWMAGSQETVCFVSQAGTPTVAVHINLTQPAHGKILQEDFNLLSGKSECVNLKIPKDWITNQVTLNIFASSADNFYSFSKNASVRLVQPAGLMMFIQTDKPVYKPSDMVRIRIMTITGSDMKPVSDKVSLAYIEDPSKTRVMQWKNIDTANGLSSLELKLSSEPPLGKWTIKVNVLGQEQTANFEVKEYVLPKFEVQIIVQKKIYIKLRQMEWKVCGRYSYGEPVNGLVDTKACSQTWRTNANGPCVPIKKTTLKDGCAKFTGDINQLRPANEVSMLRGTIMLYAEIKERGTGIVLNSTAGSEWDYNLMSIDLSKSPAVYKPGMSYNGQGSITLVDGSPAADVNVIVDIAGKPPSLNVITDRNGIFHFRTTEEFTRAMNKSLSITASVPASRNTTSRFGDLSAPLTDNIVNQQKTVLPWFSPSRSYLQIQPILSESINCGSAVTVRVLYISTGDLPESAKFNIQLTSRNNLVFNDVTTTTKVGSANMFNFTFSLVVTPAMSNSLKLLVFYVRPDGEIIADSLITSFEQCFENKVSIGFSKSRAQPGHSASLNLSADPESLCSIAVVDKSIELMGAKYITKQSVVDMLKNQFESRIDHYMYRGGSMGCVERGENHTDSDDSKGNLSPVHESPWKKSKRSIGYRWRSPSSVIDSQQPFQDIGLLVLTDLTVETRPCAEEYMPRRFLSFPEGRDGRVQLGIPGPEMEDRGMAVPMMANSAVSREPPPALHRTFFPETWLWDLHSLGSSGKQELPVSLPHTITEWVGSGFCVSAQSGLGISSPFRITGFQPFFVSFTLPYSMIRGEKVAIPVSVFNYLKECLQVTLTVDKSSEFTLVNDTYEVSLEVCGGDTQVPSFFLIPRQIGTVNFTVRASSELSNKSRGNSKYRQGEANAQDIVTRQLLVEAEGKVEELTKSMFLCGNSSGDWMFSLPVDIVANSTRAYISVIGDVMGPALSGIDSLLTMPMGCGEQNMILFAPNIFILQYLNKTKRLTPSIHAKALSFMQTGYQRELTYRHSDGSYSAFGNSDPEGSIWLTAFVVKSFAQAKLYMFIDEKDLKMSTDWMMKVQLENGCFPQVGRVLHKEMKGGVGSSDSLTSLTAYILIALLETGMDTTSPVITNAIKCLESHSIDDAYTLSLVAYAYSLVEKNSAGGASGNILASVMLKLNNKAVTIDNMKHWSSGPEAITSDELYHSSPANIEMTAYALLALLQANDRSIVPQATPIVRWLSAQRNAYGGFSSTQDTVLALQALAKYAGLVHSDDISLRVDVSAGDIDYHSFRITSDNSLVLQKREGLAALKKVKYSMEGIGCALVQASMKYNRLSLVNDKPPSFHASASVQVERKNSCNERTIRICARYGGIDSASNMAVVAVAMVSGWVPDKSSIEKLKNQARLNLKRFEVDKDTVQLYFDELDKVERCFSFGVIQSQQVADTKPALVHVYDYYMPSSAAFVQYEIASTCPFREVLMARAMQLKADPQPKIKPTQKPNHPKPAVKSKCPNCNQTNIESVCKLSFVYKALVGAIDSLKMLEIVRFNSSSSRPRIAATHKYNMVPKCSCKLLQSGSTVFIGSPSRFIKTGRDWVLQLKNGSVVAAATPESRCPEKPGARNVG